jgi:hypothetical protein
MDFEEEFVAAIWSDFEAYKRQVDQIGASACGATAILNVFVSINFIKLCEKQGIPLE